MSLSEPLHINEASFDRVVSQSPVPVLVDFWAPWCGPCKAIAPLLDELAREKADTLRIAKVNVDDEPTLAAKFNIRSIPTLIIFSGGQIKDTLIGMTSKRDLEAKLAAAAAK